MASICVYCGSSLGTDPVFLESARLIGAYIAQQNHTLVYGGGVVGLMGVVADSALENSGKVIGVIPNQLVSREVPHLGLSELYTVSSMSERKRKMASLADCFIALPGGTGTLEEIMESFVLSQMGIERKTCGLLNVNGYYDKLLEFLDTMECSGFIKSERRSQLQVSSNPEELVGLVLPC